MSERIRWGMIGCGAVTKKKSRPAYQQVAGFDLVAVMCRRGDVAARYAREHSIAGHYDDADQLIDDAQVDAVYIATPPDSHKMYALKVAEAGKPCCIEKPIAPNHADSLQICAAFSNKQLPLFVAYYRRSLPRFAKVKALLDQGAIGAVRHVDWQLCKPPNALDLSGEYNWRTDPTIAKGGYFDDLACHGLDLFAWLLGEFEQVRGVACNQQGLYTASDAVTASWRHSSGATGTGSWNFGAHERSDRVRISGSEGEITFSVFDEQVIQINANGNCDEYAIENPSTIQLHHVENLRASLIEGAEHPSTGETACHTAWVVDEILAS